MPSIPENKFHLYFFRHGETEWNRLKRFQGSHDIPLNETGKQQALDLKNQFQNINVEAVISSDLSRARETAEIVFKDKKSPIFFYTFLREANLGLAEGKFRADFEKEYGKEMWEAWISIEEKHLDFAFPGGETKRQTRQRVIDGIEAFLHSHNYKSVAVSTHGGVISRILNFCLGELTPRVRVPNGGLFHIVIEKGVWKFEKKF
jgi:broad specificity phosphatase PhoE